jgi:hypothetical protein
MYSPIPSEYNNNEIKGCEKGEKTRDFGKLGQYPKILLPRLFSPQAFETG